MDEREYPKPVRFFCVNCKREVIGLQDENGKMRVSCSYCGAVTVSQLKGRRRVRTQRAIFNSAIIYFNVNLR